MSGAAVVLPEKNKKNKKQKKNKTDSYFGDENAHCPLGD